MAKEDAIKELKEDLKRLIGKRVIDIRLDTVDPLKVLIDIMLLTHLLFIKSDLTKIKEKLKVDE